MDETSPPTGIRYVCHCDDCQAFACFTGIAASVLDEHGGTDVYQLPASRLRVVEGREHLACVQVTPRPLLRWHCSRCRSPVANTYHRSQLSFVSLPLCSVSTMERDALLGPPSGHAWTRSGQGDLSGVRQVNLPAMLWRIASRIVSAWLTGDHRCNPLFDPATGKPIVVPRRLTLDERARLDREVRTRADI